MNEGQISGTIKCVEIFDSFNECQGVADITVTGTCGSSDEKHTFTGSAAGIVKNQKGCITGTIFGSVIGTFSHSECHASGILCGILVELKPKDPCTTVRNPYNDAQKGMLAIFKLLDKINVEKMIEVLGDGVGGLGKRLLQKQYKKIEECCHNSYKDHSKKYRTDKGSELHDDNSKFNAFL